MVVFVLSASSALVMFAGSTQSLSGSLGAEMHCTLLSNGIPSATHIQSFPVLSHIDYVDPFVLMGRRSEVLLCPSVSI